MPAAISSPDLDRLRDDVAEHPNASIRERAERLDIGKSKVHRLLSFLAAEERGHGAAEDVQRDVEANAAKQPKPEAPKADSAQPSFRDMMNKASSDETETEDDQPSEAEEDNDQGEPPTDRSDSDSRTLPDPSDTEGAEGVDEEPTPDADEADADADDAPAEPEAEETPPDPLDTMRKCLDELEDEREKLPSGSDEGNTGADDDHIRAIAREEVERHEQDIDHEAGSAEPKSFTLRGLSTKPLVISEEGLPWHHRAAHALTAMWANVPVYLVGPAGSGKSSFARRAAEAMEIDYYETSCTQQMSTASLVGYMSATGDYVPGVIYKWAKGGGVFLFDEFDACNPNVALQVNTAVANRTLTFPNCEQVNLHEDCRIIAGGNTTGRGRDARYTGRAAIDAATLDRFAVVEWSYCEAWESALAGLPDDQSDHFDRTRVQWEDISSRSNGNAGKLAINYAAGVRAVRAHVEKVDKDSLPVSPRAMIYGVQLIRAGLPPAVAFGMCVTKMHPDSSELDNIAHVSQWGYEEPEQ